MAQKKPTARETRERSKAAPKRQSKAKQYRVDEIRLEMSKSAPEQLAEFERLCKYKASIRTLWSYLNEHGYNVHQSSVWQWWHATFPIGEQAKQINALTLEFGGLDTDSLLQATLAQAVLTFNQIRDRLKEVGVSEVRPTALLGTLPAMMREIRSLTEQINNREYVTDARELELAGAYTVLAELELTFKDTAFEGPLKDAKRGALAKLEGR
jgi:hypothetical protein